MAAEIRQDNGSAVFFFRLFHFLRIVRKYEPVNFAVNCCRIVGLPKAVEKDEIRVAVNYSCTLNA